ncbi:MAG: ABC transporter permease [Clostridiaceae bacterium]|nr:ABC transporter permease [Clostridiaceae bacterium]
MKIYKKYIYLEAKRMFLSYPRICLGILSLLLLLGGFFGICYAYSSQTETANVVSVGVVAKEEEPFVDWIISAVSEMENTKTTMQFQRVTADKGDRLLQKGELNVVFIIPNDYIRSIINGSNQKITIRFAKGQTTIASSLIREISTAVSSFILDTEAALYSLRNYYTAHNLPDFQKHELELNLKYLRQIASLDQAVNLCEIDTADSYPTAASYAVSALVLLLFLWGLACSSLLASQSPAFQNQLLLQGIGTGRQILARGISFFSICLANLMLLLTAGAILLHFIGIELDDTILENPLFLILFGAYLLPVLLTACSFIQLIYEAAGDSVSGSLFLFVSVLVMGLCSGCFYPLSYLPEAVQGFARVLPVYHACQYTLSALYGSPDWSSLLWMLSETALFYLTCILFRIQKRGYD